jgi:hypothetical protein
MDLIINLSIKIHHKDSKDIIINKKIKEWRRIYLHKTLENQNL